MLKDDSTPTILMESIQAKTINILMESIQAYF